MGAEDWVKRANKRLGKCGLTLELSGKNDNLYIRGMIPGKPWEDPTRKQRRISLKIRAIAEADVKLAETVARDTALKINRGLFDWSLFGEYDPRLRRSTIADFAAQLEQEKRPTVSPWTWRDSYESIIVKLPGGEEPTEDLLLAWVLEHDPNGSTMRRKYLAIARHICRLAEIPHKRLDKLSQSVSSAPINPRLLPEDDAIAITWGNIKSPVWQATYGMLATYGLRPHELFRLNLEDFPDVRVTHNTKTGERIVPPLYPDWVAAFGLTAEFSLPDNLEWDEETPNHKLGRKIGARFSKAGYGNVYDLRHCYARRCLQIGMNSDVAAALMGHSRAIHESKYRAFIKNSVYVDIAKRLSQKITPG